MTASGSVPPTAADGRGATALQRLPPGPVDGPPDHLLASWTRRVVAVLLDQALLATVVFLAFPVQPVVPPRYVPVPPAVGGDPLTPAWTSSGGVVATVVLMLAMQAYLGSTPGKLVVGIAVVRDRDGRPAGALRTAGRLLAHLLDAILWVGYLRPLWQRQRRTFADSLAGTVVLATRRPLPFRAGTSGLGSRSAPPAGDPPPWELDAVPDRRVRLSAAAFAVCVVAVAFQGGSTSRGGTFEERGCTFANGSTDDVAGLVGGSVSALEEPGTETRLGVTRARRGEQGIRVTWDRSGPIATEEDGVVVRTVFTRADGTGARVVDHLMSGDGTVSGPGTPLTDGPAGVLLPLGTVEGLGDDWTWALSTVVDGRESPRCVARTS